MKSPHHYQKIPRSRIATFDVYSMGMQKHHISALLEFDVTDSRKKLRAYRRKESKASFNAWLIKVISMAVQQHPEAASYRISKKRLITFDHINVSIVVEKEINGKKVPIPLVIENTLEKSILDIMLEIEEAKNQPLTTRDMVLNLQSGKAERLYYRLPGFLRRSVWRFMLRHPKIAFEKMGNVVITSLGMMGRINGWFIHKSVHPISFGIGSIIQKPVVADNEITAREILNMTVLLDHDVIDGAPMVRFLNDLTRYIENGQGL
jgi:pyruvate/2-oxoglutarate dehydrogenase complex dihydrolipoamide acyltransferase (E2) component